MFFCTQNYVVLGFYVSFTSLFSTPSVSKFSTPWTVVSINNIKVSPLTEDYILMQSREDPDLMVTSWFID